MHISIVVPPYDYGGELYGLRDRRAFHNAVPLGAISVAACLREAGHELQVIDAPALDINTQEVVDQLRAFGPEAVGLSATSLLWPSASETARAIRRALDVPIVAGGPHVSLYPEHVLETPEVNWAVCGEGEETGVELFGALAEGRSPLGMDGVAGRGPDGALVQGPPRQAVRSLDALPLPAYDLLDLGLYSAPPMRVRQTPAVYMEMFRGCAYAQCTYCTSASGLQNAFRHHSPGVAADKVNAIAQRYGAREIAFIDDDFVVGKDWIQRFCDELGKRGNPVTWSCYVRASQVDETVFRSMAAAGCHQVLVGLEVLDDAQLEALHKDLTVASAEAAVNAAHAAGVDVIGLFMVGVPGTNPATVMRSVDRAIAMDLDVAVFSLYRPPPGSSSYEELGWGPLDYIQAFKTQREAVIAPPPYRDVAHVERVYAQAYLRFYGSQRFLKRTARRALRDRVFARNVLQGARTLLDQFRPRLGR